MWISLNILSDLVDISGLSPEEIALKLTMSTAETEDIKYINQHFKTIVTAKITNIEKHPDADKLTLVELDSGNEKHKVVCGAPNHKVGDIVPLALEGTKFSEEFIIKKTKIRGIESKGMLCSEKELDLADDASGILIYPENTKIGIPLSELYKDSLDICIEIDNKSITHRPDLWGHLGFAREIAAIFNRKIKHPVNMQLKDSFANKEKLNVSIDCPETAARYCGLVVKNIKIEESPDWLKSRLIALGMRPINNIVDITNYVMIELGEPMHAFDRKKLNGDDIVVRMAKDGETLTTLDDSENELCKEDIVIADKNKPIALAGVMGGANSEIDDSTTEIVLEAANFDAVHIRKTAHRYDNRSDASMRFEKSLDAEICDQAIIRCYELIKELIPEAEAVTEIIDAYATKNKTVVINTNTDYIRKSLGENLPDEKIIGILTSLDYKIENNGSDLTITVPSYRATKDVSIGADIVEEVGRIFGYDNITPVSPLVPCTPPEINVKRSFERKIKNILTKDNHLIEVFNYSFVGEDLLNKLEINHDKELRLKNQLSVDFDRLRRSLVPHIIRNIELNAKFNNNVRIYELGRTYRKDDRKSSELINEFTNITGAIYSKTSSEPIFYSSKAVVQNLLKQLKLRSVRFEPVQESLPAYAHPGRSLKVLVDNKDAGLIFEIHPKIKSNINIKGECALFDINMDILLNGSKKNTLFKELPKYPDVPFELSVVAEKFTYSDQICEIIRKSNKQYIKSVNIISIYEGEQLPEGKKSVSIKVIFGTNEKTLSHEEIESLQNNVIKSLDKKGFSLR